MTHNFFSLGRISWMLPVGAWGLYALVHQYNDFLIFFFLLGLSVLCFVLAVISFKGSHKISSVVGLLVNSPVILAGLYVFWHGISYATKF